jgi:hypothetical protein
MRDSVKISLIDLDEYITNQIVNMNLSTTVHAKIRCSGSQGMNPLRVGANQPTLDFSSSTVKSDMQPPIVLTPEVIDYILNGFLCFNLSNLQDFYGFSYDSYDLIKSNHFDPINRPLYFKEMNEVIFLDFANRRKSSKGKYTFKIIDFINEYSKYLNNRTDWNWNGANGLIFGFEKSDKDRPEMKALLQRYAEPNKSDIDILTALVSVFLIKAKLTVNKKDFDNFLKKLFFDLTFNTDLI